MLAATPAVLAVHPGTDYSYALSHCLSTRCVTPLSLETGQCLSGLSALDLFRLPRYRGIQGKCRGFLDLVCTAQIRLKGLLGLRCSIWDVGRSLARCQASGRDTLLGTAAGAGVVVLPFDILALSARVLTFTCSQRVCYCGYAQGDLFEFRVVVLSLWYLVIRNVKSKAYQW